MTGLLTEQYPTTVLSFSFKAGFERADDAPIMVSYLRLTSKGVGGPPPLLNCPKQILQNLKNSNMPNYIRTVQDTTSVTAEIQNDVRQPEASEHSATSSSKASWISAANPSVAKSRCFLPNALMHKLSMTTSGI